MIYSLREGERGRERERKGKNLGIRTLSIVSICTTCMNERKFFESILMLVNSSPKLRAKNQASPKWVLDFLFRRGF